MKTKKRPENLRRLKLRHCASFSNAHLIICSRQKMRGGERKSAYGFIYGNDSCMRHQMAVIQTGGERNRLLHGKKRVQASLRR